MKFCFFGNISGALNDQTPGGGELQIALLAKALALAGHEVIIVDPYSDSDFTTSEGIRLIRVPGWNKGIRGMRLFTHRIPALKKALFEQKADFYYVRMRSYLHLVVYNVCRKVKGKFMVAAASDLDVMSLWEKAKHEYFPKFNLFRLMSNYIPSDIVYKYLLKNSDYVLLQHSGQKPENFKVKGEVLVYPNIIDCSKISIVAKKREDYFVHVGALTYLKGSKNLEKLLDIINERCNVMVIGHPADRRSKHMAVRLKERPNVIYKGWLKHKAAIENIAGSKALINTSNFEGFPNIFLEAWATGTPVISLNVDPGNILEKFQLGVCCKGDLNKMKFYMENLDANSFCRENLISYIREHHDFSTAADRFIKTVLKRK
ncbi:MAG: glycosyltransferase [Chitinophagales bacterium]|nr:glycosyltransferase [Chitinophagales bacterium]